MKIRFTADRVLDDGTKFEKGQVYDLVETSAMRWIKRQVAELVTEPEPDSKASDLEEVASVESPETAVRRPRGRPRKVVADAVDVNQDS